MWRTVERPLWKLRAATMRSNSARGSGSPVSTCAVMCERTSHSQQKFSMNWLGARPRPTRRPGCRTRPGVHAREQLVQPVAELVEERRDFGVRERRRPAGDGRGEVAGEVGDRVLDARAGAAAVDGVVHPRAALLARARVVVEVELADQGARRVGDLEEAHVAGARLRHGFRGSISRRAFRRRGTTPRAPSPRESTGGPPARRTRSASP